jgi:hypothetical protein
MANTTIERLKKTQRIMIVIALVLGAIGLAFVIHGLYFFGLCNKGNLNLLGDYLGGTTGSFWSAAGLVVVYLAFIAQRLQLEMQNEEINETKEGLEKQVFENTFFNLLKLHSSTVRDIDMMVSHTPIRGKDCIRAIMNDFKSAYNNADGNSTEEKAINTMQGLLPKHSLDISTFFNSLFALISMVESKQGEQYKYYSSIIVSQLSSYESALLYYYSLVDSRFSKFVAENEIFKRVNESFNSPSLLLK